MKSLNNSNKRLKERTEYEMKIYDVTDERFKKYGRVVKNIDFSELVKVLEESTPMPDGVEYVPSLPALE